MIIAQRSKIGQDMNEPASLKTNIRLVHSTTGAGISKYVAQQCEAAFGRRVCKSTPDRKAFRVGGSIWNGVLHMLARRFGVQLDRQREEQIRHLYVYDFEIGTLQGGCKSFDNFFS